MSTGVEQLEAWQRERLGTVLANYAFVGASLISIGKGEASVRVLCPPEFEAGGQFNGGVLSGLLEVPSFLALLTELRENETPVTNDLFVQHLRGVPAKAEIVLDGKLIRRGRSMAWTEASARADGVLTTQARITKTLLAG